LPIREISAESVRDKSIRHGHISTLHLWWARRPLSACRAIVFSSLVPDPDDPDCPAEFRDAVVRLLKDNVPSILTCYWRGRNKINNVDPYKPYDNIPDTPRNRLLTFIAKWSPEWIAFEKGEETNQPPPKEMLDDRCLVKWETSNPDNEQGREILRIARELVKIANGGESPTLLDPFSGGGAIPLEATRLGCQAIANDYNPVAYLILRATCEFPQKYGNPGVRDGKKVKNVLTYDVEYWVKQILEKARERIGYLYPSGSDGKPVVGYLWARTAPCSNPTCRAEIPLLKRLLICDNSSKRVVLTMDVDDKDIVFGVAKNRDITQTDGTVADKGVRCPICRQITPVTDIKRASFEGKFGERMVAVITDTPNGKEYRPVESTDIDAFKEAKKLSELVERPNEQMPGSPVTVAGHGWNFKAWGSLFNPRQLLAMQTFVSCLYSTLKKLEDVEPDLEYRKAVGLYLGFWVSKNSMFLTTFGKLHAKRETLDQPFDKQAITMKWDFPEVNPFNEVTGGAIGQLGWILRVVTHESYTKHLTIPSKVYCGDSAHLQLADNSLDSVVTDPPYFDSISYADLSDFFYIWLKRGIGDIFPETFITPLTPKTEETTALKHRHGGNGNKANKHYTSKLSACFAEAKRVCKPDGIITVMFAHQATEAWTALINALFEAGLSIEATYPIDTELKNRSIAIGTSALESSITVVCRPREVGSASSFRDVRREIEKVVADSVHRFWDYGFRGADLIVACYGPAVGVFGKYERVERADGTPVNVPELLELAKESALKAISGEFTGDSVSRLYTLWANLYGTSQQAWDDARLVAQVGGDSEDAMELARRRDVFVVDGSNCRLALLRDRIKHHNLGESSDDPLIDQLHHAMQLWKEERRPELVNYLRENGLIDHPPFWKLAQALFEVMPRDEEDWKLINVLLGERETLRIEARRTTPSSHEELF